MLLAVHFIMLKCSTHQEDVLILFLYALNNSLKIYMKQKKNDRTMMKNKSTIIVDYYRKADFFYHPFSPYIFALLIPFLLEFV